MDKSRFISCHKCRCQMKTDSRTGGESSEVMMNYFMNIQPFSLNRDIDDRTRWIPRIQFKSGNFFDTLRFMKIKTGRF